MPTEKIDFGKPYPSITAQQLRDGVAQSLIGGYIDVDDSYVKFPGLTTFATTAAANAKIDGLFETQAGLVLVVSGGLVFELASNGTLSAAYTGAAITSGNLSFAEDAAGTVMIADGGKLARVDTGANTVTRLGSASPSNVTHVCWMRGFFLCTGGGVAGDSNYSDDAANLYDAQISWEAFNNEAVPDASTGVFTAFDEVYAVGPQSIETSWLRATDPDNPFETIQGTVNPNGVRGPYTFLPAFDDRQWYLGNKDSGIYVLSVVQRQAKSMSSPYDSVIQGLTDHVNAKAWGINFQGTPFYVLTFPADDLTLCYNLKTKSWSQLGYWDATAKTYSEHLTNCYLYVKAWNKHLVGTRLATGKIYTLGGLTDNTNPTRMALTSGNVSRGTDRLKLCDELIFKLRRGTATDISEPRISVEFRDNGGAWSRPRYVSMGWAGQDEFYGSLTQCGSYRSRQYRIVHDDTKSDCIITSVEERFRVGAL